MRVPSSPRARNSGLQPRRGLSLLEVIVALAIFLFSLVALSQVIDIGVDMAQEMDMRSHGAHLAQSKLAEVVAGAVPLTSQADTPCDGDDGDWNWRLDAEQDAVASLYKVTVTVSRKFRKSKVEATFSQYVLDPTKRGSTDANSLGADDTTSATTTGSTTP